MERDEVRGAMGLIPKNGRADTPTRAHLNQASISYGAIFERTFEHPLRRTLTGILNKGGTLKLVREVKCSRVEGEEVGTLVPGEVTHCVAQANLQKLHIGVTQDLCL